jgi:uncharacterized membrane protein
VVLAGYDTGNALPAWAPVRVVIGHGPESVNLAELRPEVEAFYAGATPRAARMRLLREYKVGYVFWGPEERALGDWDPGAVDYLEPVYDQDGYGIWKVGRVEGWKVGLDRGVPWAGGFTWRTRRLSCLMAERYT